MLLLIATALLCADVVIDGDGVVVPTLSLIGMAMAT